MQRNETDMKFKQTLIKQVKAAGQELIDRAEDLVGTSGAITDMKIVCEFDQDGIPTINLQRGHVVKNFLGQEAEKAQRPRRKPAEKKMDQ